MKTKYIIAFLFLYSASMGAQNPNQLGAWYMYFFNTKFKESSFGVQGDIQYRNFNIAGDLEQMLVRGGITYKPKKADVTFTMGVAHITTGTLGTNSDTTPEFRLYQEILMPHKISQRLFLNHRFRYEQRFLENQDLRTRFRYSLISNVLLNKNAFVKNSVYLAFYNEIFINGEKNIGNSRTVNTFDRNRFYAGLGYMLTDKLRFQLGVLNQSVETSGKDQLQLSLHHTF